MPSFSISACQNPAMAAKVKLNFAFPRERIRLSPPGTGKPSRTVTAFSQRQLTQKQSLKSFLRTVSWGGAWSSTAGSASPAYFIWEAYSRSSTCSLGPTGYGATGIGGRFSGFRTLPCFAIAFFPCVRSTRTSSFIKLCWDLASLVILLIKQHCCRPKLFSFYSRCCAFVDDDSPKSCPLFHEPIELAWCSCRSQVLWTDVARLCLSALSTTWVLKYRLLSSFFLKLRPAKLRSLPS